MRFGRRRAWFGALVIVNVCVLGAVAAARQAPAPQGPLMSENYFKNIQVLKGIPVDEFMDTMGMFAASLGYDCASCHSSQLYNDRAAFAIATPQIQRLNNVEPGATTALDQARGATSVGAAKRLGQRSWRRTPAEPARARPCGSIPPRVSSIALV